MKKFLKLYTNCRAARFPDKARQIGFACQIIFMCRNYSVFEIISLRYWITPAIDHKQILFFFDSNDSPIGYVTWAHLASDSELRLLHDPAFLLHPCEWNEGGKTWIIDFCFPLGGVADAITYMKKYFTGQGINQIFWHRQVRGTSAFRLRNITTIRSASDSL